MEPFPKELLEVVGEYDKTPVDEVTGLPLSVVGVLREYLGSLADQLGFPDSQGTIKKRVDLPYLYTKSQESRLPAEYDYVDPGEKKMTIPYLYTENQMEKLPKEIQKMVADYVAPVDYKSLVILAKLGKLPKLRAEEIDIINQPWSEEKIYRIIDSIIENYSWVLYPILREAVITKNTFLNISHLSDIFNFSLEKEDYQLAKLIGDSADETLFRDIFTIIFRDLYQSMWMLGKISETGRLSDDIKRASQEDRVINLLNKTRREIRFLFDNYHFEIPKRHLSLNEDEIAWLLNLGWYDVIEEFISYHPPEDIRKLIEREIANHN